MKIALIRTKNSKEEKRGVDYYSDRLFASLKNISDIDLSWQDYNYSNHYSGFDIVHVPFFEPYTFGLPINVSGKLVVTIHDVTRLVFPEQFPAGPRGKLEWLAQRFFLRKIDHVFTDSDNSKKDIIRLLKIPPEKISVSYLAADPIFQPINSKKSLNQVAKKYLLPKEFALYVGQANWNKNVISLCKACLSLHLPLVLVNKIWVEADYDRTNIENVPLDQTRALIDNNPNFHRLGFLPTTDLASIYNLASVYVQPSYYEGFGLPFLEALSCGTPTVSSGNSSLVEIGGDAPVYVNNPDSDSLAHAIKQVLNWSSGERLKRKTIGRAQAGNFSWDKTAAVTYDGYLAAMKRK